MSRAIRGGRSYKVKNMQLWLCVIINIWSTKTWPSISGIKMNRQKNSTGWSSGWSSWQDILRVTDLCNYVYAEFETGCFRFYKMYTYPFKNVTKTLVWYAVGIIERIILNCLKYPNARQPDARCYQDRIRSSKLILSRDYFQEMNLIIF